MTQRLIERRNNERKKKVDFFSVWSFKTQLILIEKFAKESHYRQQHYKRDFSGTWVQMFFWRPYLSKVLVSITVIKSFFLQKKIHNLHVCLHFFVCAFLCVPVCTHTYLCVGICICWHMYSCMHIQSLEATIRYLPHLLCVFYLLRQILSRN